MSRLAKKPVILSPNSRFELRGDKAILSGPKGEVVFLVHENVDIQKQDGELWVTLRKKQKNTKAMLGTTYSLLKNAVQGVENGFEKKLEIEGIGYKAQIERDTLLLFLGFTHPIKIKAPRGISFKIEKNTIMVSGADKEIVGRVAAEIRSEKPPEPYKGKGIHYLGEIIRRKAGKKAVGTT